MPEPGGDQPSLFRQILDSLPPAPPAPDTADAERFIATEPRLRDRLRRRKEADDG
jgi:hypothetical protein